MSALLRPLGHPLSVRLLGGCAGLLQCAAVWQCGGVWQLNIISWLDIEVIQSWRIITASFLLFIAQKAR